MVSKKNTEKFGKEKWPNLDLKNELLNAGKGIKILASDVADRAKGYVSTSRKYVKENPGKGLAIATAAGIVTGSLITLAMREKKL